MKRLLTLSLFCVSLMTFGQTSYSEILNDCTLSTVTDFFKVEKDEVLNKFRDYCVDGTGKNEKFAVLLDWKSMPLTDTGFKFENGFHQNMLHKSVAYDYLYIKDIIIPIKQGCAKYESYTTFYTFKCDAATLNTIKSDRKPLRLLAIFKPGFFMNAWIDHYCAVPVGLYLVNKDTGAVLQNLSSYLKNINITTEKQKLTKANRAKVAEERQSSGNTQPTKMVRCNTCHGTGQQKWEYPNKTKYETCQTCAGRGYVPALW